MRPDPGHDSGASAESHSVVATVIVCSSCRGPDGSDARPRPGERLAEAARHLAGDGVEVREAECLGNCKRRLSAAVVCPGAWTYVFGDLTEANASDLVTGAILLREAADGLMPWRGRPDCLKRGLVARIPPLNIPENP